jgi:inner membrane protein
MDNVCHTLVGAALAEAGLKRKTALGSATLMIAANVPDLDVISVPFGHSLGFRRGITHGVPALVLLPILLTMIMIGWHRWRGRASDAPNAKWLLLLSTIGILTHPFLDWMNTYGMRWLMPLSGRWWYADTLFIVDPWIWLALGAGAWISSRRSSLTPARLSLVLTALYIAAMAALATTSRNGVRDVLTARGITADTVVLEPVPANPLRRRVIYHWNSAYHLADYAVLRRELSEPWFSIRINQDHPAVARANATPQGREYQSWTRLPYYVIDEARDTTWVTMADARYTVDGRSSWAVARIPVPPRSRRSEKE